MKVHDVAAGMLLVLATVACQFSAGAPLPSTIAPTLHLASPTYIMPASSTPLATNTVVAPTPTPRVRGGTVCYPRSDWQSIMVQPGETLNMIAQRSGTTATALALANCLTNADFIQAGQVLRVPVLLPTATRTVAPQTWTPQNVVVTATPTTTIIPLGTRLP